MPGKIVLSDSVYRGIQIPEDISMVGFNDRPICQMTRPQLSSISVPKELFGCQAVDMLVERIGGQFDQAIGWPAAIDPENRGEDSRDSRPYRPSSQTTTSPKSETDIDRRVQCA